MRLFVYYRVAAADLLAVRQAVLAMQASLCAAHDGLRAELLRRPQFSEGQVTLMETYAGNDDAGLEQAIEAAASALTCWLQGSRHVEVFVEP